MDGDKLGRMCKFECQVLKINAQGNVYSICLTWVSLVLDCLELIEQKPQLGKVLQGIS